MKQSSVEWLVDKVMDMIHESNHAELSEIYQQAKAMHKEEIETAYQSERYPCSDYDAQEYYNQTFGE